MSKPTAKDQGVPDAYLGPGGRFRPGMDARYKSDLIASALGIETDRSATDRPSTARAAVGSKTGALMTFDPKDAKKRLMQRGWGGFLEQKRKALAAEQKRRSE